MDGKYKNKSKTTYKKSFTKQAIMGLMKQFDWSSLLSEVRFFFLFLPIFPPFKFSIGLLCISVYSLFASISFCFDNVKCISENRQHSNDLINIAGCYSSLEDQNCWRNGTAHDTIFYRRNCIDISSICAENKLDGINATYCLNSTTNQLVPIRKVIKRVLASEEYY